MAGDLETRVGKIEAAEDIRRLKAHYAKVCDTGYKSAGMKPLFTEDATWEDTSGRFGKHVGRKAICDFFDGVSDQIAWALHYMVAPSIEVDDDLTNATGTWYLWQPCTVDGQPVWLTGTYLDRYRKEDGVWKFSQVQLSLETISPFEEGWVKRPFMGEAARV